MTTRTFAKMIAATSMLLGSLSALAQTSPTVITPTGDGIAPNGIGVTINQLLFSQPFCLTQPRGIYSYNVGTNAATEITPITLVPPCSTGSGGAENYLIISPGLGGFPVGSVYTTNPIDSGHDQVLVSPGGGGAAAVFATNIPDSAPGHAGITFDTIGTFGNALIVTTPGAVYGFNAAGTLVFTYPVTASAVFLESATVAPQNLGAGACQGCLYVTSTTGTGTGDVFTIAPGTPTNTPIGAPIATVPGEPEGILFVPQTSCTLSGTNLTYFVSGYATGGQIDVAPSTSGALLGYSVAQLAPYLGKALVPIEVDSSSTGGSIKVFDPATKTFSSTAFSTTSYQLEGASLAACAPVTGCPATQGYWKKHLKTSASLTIGGVTLNKTQLVNFLTTAPQGGNATLILLHQLIAAMANEAAGAQHVNVSEDGVMVDAAIAQANTLLTGLLTTTSSTYVAAGSTLGQQMVALSVVLDDYNNAVGLNCSEASGLN